MAEDKSFLLAQTPHRHTQPASAGQSAEVVRQALMDHVYSHCCCGNHAAQEMDFDDITATFAYKYTLESYTESRSLSEVKSLHIMGEILDYTKPELPSCWDIRVPAPSKLFVDSTLNMAIPSTAYLKRCDKCDGTGFCECPECSGLGKDLCNKCNGDGFKRELGDNRLCSWCNGRGTDTFNCSACNGHRTTSCKKCDTQGFIKYITQLSVKRKNRMRHFVVGVPGLPGNLVQDATGTVVFTEQSEKVDPITNFPEQSIKSASVSLIGEQESASSNQRILMQRHVITRTPVTKVYYTWRNQSSWFFVYGTEDKVHAPDYPRGCNCCSIL